jgi:hypothetical protein
MEPRYTWIKIGIDLKKRGCCQTRRKPYQVSIIDIMGALTQRVTDFESYIRNIFHPGAHICISGELKDIDGGRVASNFRFSKDKLTNNRVVDNYLKLFDLNAKMSIQSPVFVNTIPRKQRKYSFYLSESGKIQTKTNVGDSDPVNEHNISELLTEFLGNFGIKENQIKKLRKSCKSGKYHTYLIDIISFLYQVNNCSGDFWDLFMLERKKTNIAIDDNLFKHLYFKDASMEEKAISFYVPKYGSIDKIYELFVQAIDSDDNQVKSQIRKHCNTNIIYRWTDFDVNDIDDALTLLLIIHAYKQKQNNLCQIEKNIVKSIENQMKPWFSQLK